MNATTTRVRETPLQPRRVVAGEIWREMDKRHPRHVLIVNVLDDVQKAVIHTVNPVTFEKCGPVTQVRINRFNGRRGGCELMRAATC